MLVKTFLVYMQKRCINVMLTKTLKYSLRNGVFISCLQRQLSKSCLWCTNIVLIKTYLVFMEKWSTNVMLTKTFSKLRCKIIILALTLDYSCRNYVFTLYL